MLWGTTSNVLWNHKKRGRQFYGYLYFYFRPKISKERNFGFTLPMFCSPAITLIFFNILRWRTVFKNAIDLLFPLYQLSDSWSVNNGSLLLHHLVISCEETKRCCSFKTFNQKVSRVSICIPPPLPPRPKLWTSRPHLDHPRKQFLVTPLAFTQVWAPGSQTPRCMGFAESSGIRRMPKQPGIKTSGLPMPIWTAVNTLKKSLYVHFTAQYKVEQSWICTDGNDVMVWKSKEYKQTEKGGGG